VESWEEGKHDASYQPKKPNHNSTGLLGVWSGSRGGAGGGDDFRLYLSFPFSARRFAHVVICLDGRGDSLETSDDLKLEVSAATT